MSLRLLIATLVLCTVAHAKDDGEHKYGLETPKPKADGAVRVACYNLLNFADHHDDPAISGDIDDMQHAVSHERCLELAEAIRAMDADILALEEVESKAALTWFRDEYLKDMGYRYVISEDVGYFRGMECSLLSRFEVTGVKTWPGLSLDDVEREGLGFAEVPAGESISFRRSPLMVDVHVRRNYSLTLIVVHHKAGRDSNVWREAEALKIVEIVEALQEDDDARNIIVLGDFNAAPWDKSFRVYLEAGMIDTLAHRNTRGEEAPLYTTHESARVLDYILMNSAAHRELVIGSAHVYGTMSPPESYDWRNDPIPEGYASDHYPVIVDLVPRDKR